MIRCVFYVLVTRLAPPLQLFRFQKQDSGLATCPNFRIHLNVPNSHRVQVVPEGSGDVDGAVVAQQPGPVHRLLNHLDEGVSGHIPLDLVGRNEA